MFQELNQAIEELPELLRLENSDKWEGLEIDYHQPFVRRIWTPWNDYRINIHRISPCGPNEALYHPHPWPSALVILKGAYEMGIGHGEGLESPPIDCRMFMNGGGCYEMLDPNGWHYVRPVTDTWTIMLTGKPWDRPTKKADRALTRLSLEDKEDMMYTIHRHLDMFPVRIPKNVF